MRADAVRNRARILNAANDLLAERGLAVPLDAIAQRAGIGAGSLHRHFQTKNALIAAVVSDRLTQITGTGRNMLSENSSHALFQFLQSLFALTTADQAIIGVIVCPPAELGQIASDNDSELHGLLNQMLIAGQAAGIVRDGITTADIKTLLSVAKTATDSNVSTERVLRVVIDGLRRQIPR